jgi:GDP-4-dehydro-6-deoxy-D-mannose reductase
MSGKVLIFGIGGFVGGYLADEFIRADYDVYGSDINKPENLPENVKFKELDLMDFNDVTKLISDVRPKMIINLAAISSVGESWSIPQKTMDVNVIGALNIMEAARKQEVAPKIMFIGSSEEYESSDNPINEFGKVNSNNPYGISKVTQEQFAALYRQQYGMKIYCVRPFNHTGVGQRESFVLPSFCRQVAEIEKSGKPGTIKVGNLAAKRDFSHVKDIVRAYRMIIESDDCSAIYNVGYGKAYGLDEMLSYIISLSSQKITVEVDEKRFRPIDTPVVCCDRRLIERNLGWKPEYSVFDALKEMFEAYL